MLVIAILVCATASKFTLGAILVWVVTIKSLVLGGVLGRYIQGGVIVQPLWSLIMTV